MTIQAKPTVKSSARRGRRPGWEADNRRTLLLNIGFGIVVAAALIILGGAVFASYYGDHFASVATVNGEGISKDDYRGRFAAETFRLNYAGGQIAAEQDAGRLDPATAQSRLSSISERQKSLSTDVAEGLIDATLQRQLAARLGLKVDDSQIDERLIVEATTPEQRHAFVIGMKPEISTGATASTDAQKTAARQKAEGVLADLRAGKIKLADYLLANSQDPSQPDNGDIGWIKANDASQEKSLVDALFTLPVDGLTDVLEGTDGDFRIGSVTEIAPASVDAAYAQKIKDAGVSMDAYRAAVRADVLAEALQNKVVGDVLNVPTAHRRVSEVFLPAASGEASAGDEVKVRHILLSPNHDPQGAQTLPASDPAWSEAENEADLIYHEVLKDPSSFQKLARERSDDSGTKEGGGDLPYYSRLNLDRAFGDAIFVDGLTADQILPPVRSAFGWHVIQYVGRRQQPVDRMRAIQDQAAVPGSDFAAIAKANSDGTESSQGGDIGWVSRLQFDSAREAAIFKAAVGGLTDVIQTTSGLYLYKIAEAVMRLPDAAQMDTIQRGGFNNWYSAERFFAKITREFSTGSSTLPTVQ